MNSKGPSGGDSGNGREGMGERRCEGDALGLSE